MLVRTVLQIIVCWRERKCLCVSGIAGVGRTEAQLAVTFHFAKSGHIIAPALDTVTLSDNLKFQVCFLLFTLRHPRGFYGAAHLSVFLIIIIIIPSESLSRTHGSSCPFLFLFLCFQSVQSHLSDSLTPLSFACSARGVILFGRSLSPLSNRTEAKSSPVSSGCLSFSFHLCFLRDLARLCWICLHIFLPAILLDVLF